MYVQDIEPRNVTQLQITRRKNCGFAISSHRYTAQLNLQLIGKIRMEKIKVSYETFLQIQTSMHLQFSSKALLSSGSTVPTS